MERHPKDFEPNGSLQRAIYFDIDKTGGHHNFAFLGFEKTAGQGQRFDRLVECTSPDGLYFGCAMFPHHSGDCAGYGACRRSC